MCQKLRKGFTLVELMVSIVIVTVLASMIFLFAKRGLEAAKAAKCVSNMHQIHAGVMAVIDDGIETKYGGRRIYLPYGGKAQNPKSRFMWYELVAESMGLAELEDGKFYFINHPKDSVFQNPLSKHTLGGEGPWERKGLEGNADLMAGGYAQNVAIAGWMPAASGKDITKLKINHVSKVPYPGITILFAEQDDAKKASTAFRGKSKPQGNYKNSAHCAFVDGHVERIPNERMNDDEWFQHYTKLAPPKKPLSVGK